MRTESALDAYHLALVPDFRDRCTTVVLTALANLGTFIASVANVGLGIFALVQIGLLRRQGDLAKGQTDAAVQTVGVARESVEATRDAGVEAARVRVDEQA